MVEEAVWRVSKLSGDASVTTSGQWLALTEGVMIKLGDNVRTGQTGQVLLKRGEETILMSPNSVIGIAAESKSGLSTTIIQQAGSILLEVEKRSVNHFAVETPTLAAVVKGTHFRVTVSSRDSRVDVLGGARRSAQSFAMFLCRSRDPGNSRFQLWMVLFSAQSERERKVTRADEQDVDARCGSNLIDAIDRGSVFDDCND